MSSQPSGIVPDIAKSEVELSGSDTNEHHKPRLAATENITFDSAGLESFYKPIAKYEGIHRYDPEFEWDPAEERKTVRKVSRLTALMLELELTIHKIDKRICTWVCLMFFALQLDRGNISQALSDNMLKDLHINTNDYNYGQTIFYLCFLSAELPSQLISKKMGPDNWIPIQMYDEYDTKMTLNAYHLIGYLGVW
jgi:hypothetical protein